MQTNVAAVNEGVVAAIAAASQPSDWFALLDQQQRWVHLQRGELGEIPEQLIGMRGGDSQDLVTDVLRRGACHQTTRIFDDPQLGRRTFEYQFRPLNDDVGVAAVVIRCSESTARRATQQAARLQSHVLEALNDGVLLIGADSVVKLFNPAAQRLLGWHGRPLVGEPITEVSAALASAVQRGGELPIEIGILRGEQESVVLDCRVRHLSINNSPHRLAILRDITDRRALEREIVDTEQRERERIGRELHDGLGQELTGLALMLRSAITSLGQASPAITQQLQEAVSIVNTVIAGTRELANGILAAAIPGRDLASALRSLAEQATARSGIAVRFTFFGNQPPPLTEAAISSLFRIAQEATTNALRHSGAASIDIVLGADSAGVSLSITDDGQGCPADAEQRGGAGLRIMRFRAHALGAQFRIAPGRAELS
jgi:PAS domain S-box-containing protein